MSEAKSNLIKEKVHGVSELIRRFDFPMCPGCGHPIITTLVTQVLEEMGIAGKTIGAAGIGCAPNIVFNLKIDQISFTHGTAPAVATGIKRVLGNDVVVFTAQGDGDCAAIGAGQLISAAARAERITVIMANNANYGTTGGQLSPTTLVEQVTTTTPEGRDPHICGYPLHVAELVATMKGVAYSARGAVNNPANFRRAKKYLKTAFQKQMDDVGFTFVEILAACPTDWHMTPIEALKWMEEKMIPEFPLGEFKNVDKIE